MSLFIVAVVFLLVITAATVFAFQLRSRCGCSRKECRRLQERKKKEKE